MEPKSPSKLKLTITGSTQDKRGLQLCSIVLVILLLLVGVFFAFHMWKSQRGLHYTVVVDCGSTGTRANVYEWESRNVGNGDLPVLMHIYPDEATKSPLGKSSCQYHCMQTEPGLDKFVGNASAVRESLEPLIKWAEQWVPHERHQDSPIFVLATAGLRSLAVNDARQVLDDVEAVVNEHSFSYKKSWIRVLTGKEEAYYGWVALNYKMGNLGISSSVPTLGLLDLGGSSLQVVIEVDKTREDEHLIRSKIGSVEHRILAYSLPAFGLNEAFDRTVAMLSQAQPLSSSNRLEVKHPCLSFDFVSNYTCYGCGTLNITDQNNFDSQMQKLDFASVILSGDPNWEQCRELARAAALNTSSFDWSQRTAGANCRGSQSSFIGRNIFNLTSATHSLGHFHALSGFFAVYNKLNLSPKANLTKIWEKGHQLCLSSWTDRSRMSGQYCFRVPYMASLVEDALWLGESEIIFGPGDVSWTLGAALVEGEYLWLRNTDTQYRILALRNIGISSPIFVFLLLLCLLFVVYRSPVKLPMPGKRGPASRPSLPSYIYPKRRPK